MTTRGPSHPWRRVVLTAGAVAVLAGQMHGGAVALGLPSGSGSKQADACAAERAPILERQKQYQAIHHSHLGAALTAGLKAGATFVAGQMLGHYLPGMPFGHSGGGGGGSGGFSFLNPANLSEAGALSIPGVTTAAGGGVFGGGNLGSGDTRALAAMAIIVAVVSTVEAYAQLKEEESGGDNIRLATSIDDDARRQVEVSRAIASEEEALDACRARQVSAYKVKLSGASNDQDRHAAARDRTVLASAIKSDVDLTGGVVEQQASLAKTYTQSRAMSENKSEADVLGGQAPAYAASASTATLKLPPPKNATSSKATTASDTGAPLKRGGGTLAARAASPPPTWTAARALTVRSAADNKARPVGSVAGGAPVEVTEAQGGPAGWSLITAAGISGYVRTSSLVKSAAPAGPRLAPPSNIREHNRAVLVARDQGPNRLKTLLTDVQAG